jgi:hypothetical protein
MIMCTNAEGSCAPEWCAKAEGWEGACVVEFGWLRCDGQNLGKGGMCKI